jgi:hypothetical protein
MKFLNENDTSMVQDMGEEKIKKLNKLRKQKKNN